MLSQVAQIRDSHHRRLIAQFLEHLLPVQLLVHLTFARPVSEQERDTAFQAWKRSVQALHGCTIAFVRGDEARPWSHIHVVLISHVRLSCAKVRDAWLDIVGHEHRTSVVAEEYERGAGGLEYVMKGMDSDGCDVRFSDNLHLFAASTRACPKKRTNARERRQVRRVQQQCRAWPPRRSSSVREVGCPVIPISKPQAALESKCTDLMVRDIRPLPRLRS